MQQDAYGGGERIEPLDLLLQQVGRDDQEAFARLYDHLAGTVHGLVSCLLPDGHEEVTGETFIEIWRTAPAFDATRDTAMAWCLAIACDRAAARTSAGGRPGDRPAPSGRSAGTGDLAALTRSQRLAVVLAGRVRSHRRVAELLDLPPRAVARLMRDALIRLRDSGGRAAGDRPHVNA